MKIGKQQQLDDNNKEKIKKKLKLHRFIGFCE